LHCHAGCHLVKKSAYIKSGCLPVSHYAMLLHQCRPTTWPYLSSAIADSSKWKFVFYKAPSLIFLEPIQCVVQFCTCGKVLYRLSKVCRGSRKSIKHTTNIKINEIHIIRRKCCQLESTYLKEITVFITIQVLCRNQVQIYWTQKLIINRIGLGRFMREKLLIWRYCTCHCWMLSVVRNIWSINGKDA